MPQAVPIDPLESGHSPPSLEGHRSIGGVIRRILRPLVRLAIARGLKFQHFSAILKSVYVDAACEIVGGRRSPNVSRLSVLTGLQRKDVAARLAEGDQQIRFSLSMETQLFARWVGDPLLRDADGRPRPLPRFDKADPSDVTFEELARSVTSDVHPRAILESLIRLGVVALDADDKVHALTDRFVPSGEEISLLEFMRDHVHDHLAATVNNLAGRPPMLEQSIFVHGISSRSETHLHQASRDVWQRILQQITPLAQAAVHEDRGTPRESRRRVRVGMYFYAEPEFSDDTRPDNPESKSPR